MKDNSHRESGPRGDSNPSTTRRVAAIASQLTSVKSITLRPGGRDTPAARAAKDWRHLPSFKELPAEGGFPGCAWDVWGKGDQLGTVNMLTDTLVARSAKEEVKNGHCISLNWAMHLPLSPMFNRRAMEHKLIGKSGPYGVKVKEVQDAMKLKGRRLEDRSEKGSTPSQQPAPVSDEELHLNTQSGTQWDGMRHFGHLHLNCFYQGIPRAAIQDFYEKGLQLSHCPPSAPASEREKTQLGIQNWAKHGIVGRGVLLDIYGYQSRKAKSHKPKYDPCETHAITLAEIRECALAQGVHFRQGDILLLRTGFTTRYHNSTAAEREAWATRPAPRLAGVEQGQHVLEWIWDHHFAAVAGDAPAFEAWPPKAGEQYLHETLLGFFGMPIGEMFDLEELSRYCIAKRRWTFHFTSWPLNLHGGAASPANAAAYF